MGWIEGRIQALEQRVEYISRYLQDLLDQIRAATQNARNAYNQAQPSGANAGAVYVCYPTTIAGATGTFPSLVPGSQSSLDVYQVTGSTITLLGAYTVYNWLPASPAASKVAYCLPDGAGNFVLIDQSCT